MRQIDERSAGTDMTTGSIPRQMIFFSLPLMLGSLLQESYNFVDAIVVGNFVGKGALAAVGMSLPVVTMIIGLFMGMSNGTTVVIARYFGTKDHEKMRGAVHTSVLLAAFLGVISALTGIAITPWLLYTINTPSEIFDEAVIYFSVFFAGLPALMIYNMGTAILNALGDSQRPLLLLAIAIVVNLALNMLFVVGFHFGIAGAAGATVISEAGSAVLVLIIISRPGLPCRLERRFLHVDLLIIGEILRIGAPISVRILINGASNLFMQWYINGLGASVIAGWGITAKIDAFIFTMAGAVALGVTTFVGQNLGAGNVQRARRGVMVALVFALAVTFVISAILLLLNYRFLRLFTSDIEVLSCAFTFMMVLTTSYFIMSIPAILQNALTAGGQSLAATVTNIFSHVIVRQIYLLVIARIVYTPVAVAMAYPLAWVISGILLVWLYIRNDWKTFARPSVRDA
jgi:putative MATE family efflux protein